MSFCFLTGNILRIRFSQLCYFLFLQTSKTFSFWYLPFCSKTFFFRREPRFLERRYLTIPCFCSEHKSKRGHGFKSPNPLFFLLLVQSFLYHKIQSSNQLHLYKFVEGEKDFLRYFLCFFSCFAEQFQGCFLFCFECDRLIQGEIVVVAMISVSGGMMCGHVTLLVLKVRSRDLDNLRAKSFMFVYVH